MVTSLTISTKAKPFLVLISEIPVEHNYRKMKNRKSIIICKLQQTIKSQMEIIHTFIALCKRFIQKPVGYLLHILGQWVSSAQVYSFFCNLLRSHVSRLHASGKKYQEFHFGFGKKYQEFHFGFVNNRQKFGAKQRHARRTRPQPLAFVRIIKGFQLSLCLLG